MRMDPTHEGGVPGHGVGEAAVSMDAVAMGYGHTVAVEAMSLHIPVGTTTALIGPNGSGKSTVLRTIAGLLEPLSGEVSVRPDPRGAGVAFVMQATDVDEALPITVAESVRMATYPRRGLFRPLSAEGRERVEGAMELLRLEQLSGRQLHDLSGGQRQRALVAQGLAQGSALLLLDEPFTGLDIPSREDILAAMGRERDQGRTVLFSTHDLDDARRADLVLLLAGRCIAFGPPGEVLRSACLAEAYGTRMLKLDDGMVLVDDPHHDHEHDPAHESGPRDGHLEGGVH